MSGDSRASSKGCAAEVKVVGLPPLIGEDDVEDVLTGRLQVLLRNAGSERLIAVNTGDGSYDGRRPVELRVEVRGTGAMGGALPTSARIDSQINSLELQDIFLIPPGHGVFLNNTILPPVLGPGTYEVRARYTNRPRGRWAEGLGPHNRAAMRMARRSVRCDITSAWMPLRVESE